MEHESDVTELLSPSAATGAIFPRVTPKQNKFDSGLIRSGVAARWDSLCIARSEVPARAERRARAPDVPEALGLPRASQIFVSCYLALFSTF